MKRKILFCGVSALFWSLPPVPARAQVQTRTVAASAIPKTAIHKGTVVRALSWTDKNGGNMLLLTETNEIWDRHRESRTRELYAYHYANRKTATYQLLRQIHDFEKDCPLDIALAHLSNSLTVTDLDKDGFAEITFLYTNGCKGDVSPDALKLMLLENGAKYAIRGETTLYQGGKPLEGYANGTPKTVDASFAQAPKAFLAHANRQWETHCIVDTGEQPD